MPEFVSVAKVSDLAPGTGKVVDVNGVSVALFRIGAAIFAIDNNCPHRGGPLGEGTFIGRLVTCPLHLWDFDVCTGEYVADPDIKVPTYSVQVEGDDVKVAV